MTRSLKGVLAEQKIRAALVERANTLACFLRDAVEEIKKNDSPTFNLVPEFKKVRADHWPINEENLKVTLAELEELNEIQKMIWAIDRKK